MSQIDGRLRNIIEQQIDIILDSPNALSTIKEKLGAMSIQPSLETTLSYITGNISGYSEGMWLLTRMKDGKPTNPTLEQHKTFLKELDELLARRAMELRQHFVKEEYM